MNRDEIVGVMTSVLKAVAEAKKTIQLFACAVDKTINDDPLRFAFAHLYLTFTQYLKSIWRNGAVEQRGLLIFDETIHETALREMANLGGAAQEIGHLCDAPFFVDSRTSRLVQAADQIAYAVFRRYNGGDARFFDVIASRFYTEGGVIRGLIHVTADDSCVCPACLSRRVKETTSP